MARLNKLISAIVLTCFLLNTAVSDLAFGQSLNFRANTDKLANASPFNGILQDPEITDLAHIKMWFVLFLNEFAKNNPKEITAENLKNFYIGNKNRLGNTSFQPEGADLNVLSVNEVADVIKIKFQRKDNVYGSEGRIYWIEYSVSGKKIIAAYREGKRALSQEEEAAKARYEHQQTNIDTVLEWAHKNKVANFINLSNYIALLKKALNIKIDNPDSLRIKDIEKRELSLVNLEAVRKNMPGFSENLLTTKAIVNGKEIEIRDTRAHSSNRAINILIDKEIHYDVLMMEENDFLRKYSVNIERYLEILNEAINIVRVRLSHEIGVMANLPLINGYSNELDLRYQKLMKLKGSIVDLIPIDEPLLRLKLVDLNTAPAILKREYAASEPEAKLRDMQNNVKHLEIINRILEKDVIGMLFKAGSGHPGGSLSMLKMITALYFGTTKDGKRIMNVDPKNPNWVNRDEFVLSKGHGGPGLYAALGRRGFFDTSAFDTLRKLGSILQGHPDMTKTPGVDMSTGSLGVGISAAVGMALAAKMDNRDYTTYVMLGDGETQEGQVWESARYAAKMGLDNIVAFLDWNGMQIDGKVTDVDVDYEGQVRKWEAYEWNVIRADGEDMASVIDAISTAKSLKRGKPTIIIANTKKGAGLPGMSKHGSVPVEADVKAANDIIDKDLVALAGESFNADNYINSAIEKVTLTKDEITKIDRVNEEAFKARRAEIEDIIKGTTAQKIIAETRAAYAADKKVSTRTANGDELVLLGAEDPNVVLLSADLRGSVMFDKFEEAFGTFSANNPTGRYVTVGISEDLMVSMAAGLAARGKMPIIGTFSIFLTRVVDQLNAILNTILRIILVGTHGGLATGPDGRTHQDGHSQGVLGALPKLHLYEAADAEEARILARYIYSTAKREGGIHYIRPARLDTPILTKPEGWQEGVKKGFYPIYDSESGKSKSDVKYDMVMVSTGVIAVDVIEAAKELAAEGKKVMVINVPQPNEINSEKNSKEFAKLIGRASNIISVIDALPEILGDRINRVLVKERITPDFVRNLGIKNYGESGTPKELYALHGFDKAGILKTARLLMGTGIEKLREKGQSVWADGAFTPDEIAFFIRKGVTGQTTNLTIINNAIKAGMFDDKIRAGIEKGLTPEQIYDEVCISYIRGMAEAWKEVYDKTNSKDGYVSIEVNPDYANDVERTVAEAERLVKAIGMPNVMVKIPATPAGIKAIEELTYRGINVNVTLLFGVANCMEAKAAHDRGLARRHREGNRIDNVHSVLSFFVSRVNCKPGACDEQLRKLIEAAKASGGDVQKLSDLIGKAAIANTILAYDKWAKDDFGIATAYLQRLLWASTETKSSEVYADGSRFAVLTYVVNMPLEFTVNTMPKNTLEATIVADNVEPEARNKMSAKEAQGVMDALKAVGINIDEVTNALQKDGVASFAKDYADSLQLIRKYVEQLKAPALATPAPPAAPAAASAKPVESLKASSAKPASELANSRTELSPEAENSMEIIAKNDSLRKPLESIGLSLDQRPTSFSIAILRVNLEILVTEDMLCKKVLENFGERYFFTPAGREKMHEISTRTAATTNTTTPAASASASTDKPKAASADKPAAPEKNIVRTPDTSDEAKAMLLFAKGPILRGMISGRDDISFSEFKTAVKIDSKDIIGKAGFEKSLRAVFRELIENGILRKTGRLFFSSRFTLTRKGWKLLREIRAAESKFSNEYIDFWEMPGIKLFEYDDNTKIWLFSKNSGDRADINDEVAAFRMTINGVNKIPMLDVSRKIIESLKIVFRNNPTVRAYGGARETTITNDYKTVILTPTAMIKPKRGEMDIEVLGATKPGEKNVLAAIPAAPAKAKNAELEDADMTEAMWLQEAKQFEISLLEASPMLQKFDAHTDNLLIKRPDICKVYLSPKAPKAVAEYVIGRLERIYKSIQEPTLRAYLQAAYGNSDIADRASIADRAKAIFDKFEAAKQSQSTASEIVPAIEKSIGEISKEILDMIPKAIDGWLNLETMNAILSNAGWGQGMIADDNSAIMVSEQVGFGARTDDGSIEEGILPILPDMINSGVKIAVIAKTDRQKELIAEFNRINKKEHPEAMREIICADSPADAREKLHVARCYYFKVKGEPDAGIVGVTSIEIVVKNIIRAIGKIMQFEQQLVEQMHEAARITHQAA